MKRKFNVTQYALISKNGKLLVLRDNDCVKGKWVLPGGHVDMELDPLKALKRELKEETNLSLVKATIFKTDICKYTSEKWKYRVYFKCNAKGEVKLSLEHDKYLWVSKNEAQKMTFRDNKLKNIVLESFGR